MKKFLTSLTTILLFSQFSGDVFAFEDCKSDRRVWTRCEGTKAIGDHIYSGEWRNGDAHGQGTIIYNKGDKYEGQFKNGRKDGQGTYTFTNGRQYVGEFKNGRFHGQGTFTWPDGKEYVGEWKDNNYHGQGTMTYASGRIEEGIWEDDKYLGSTAIEIEQNKMLMEKYASAGRQAEAQNKKRQDEAQNKKRQEEARRKANKVTENDINRACAIISSSRNYESSLRLKTLHELDEKAGKEYTSSVLEELSTATIKIMAMSGGSFEYNCRDYYEDIYMK